MAYIRKRGARWRAEVERHGVRESDSFGTRAEAAAWALEREATHVGGVVKGMALKSVLQRYGREISPKKKGCRWERVRLKKFERYAIAKVALDRLTAKDVVKFRDQLLTEVSGPSVRRELNLLRSVLETARLEWRMLRVNPMADVKRPPNAPPRRRRIDDDEIERICVALGHQDGQIAKTAQQRIAAAFLFALETAMRAGEILGLRKRDMREDYAILPRTKNGDRREVPLSTRAREILSWLPKNSSTVFGLEPAIRDALFRKARDAAKVENLRFHDSRAEAIWRLSKKLDVLQLARMIGHRDIKSLMLYYDESPSELAKRLG